MPSNSEWRCPRCQSPYVTEGKFINDRGRAYSFLPSGLRFWSFSASAAPLPNRGLIAPNALGCAACGLVWSEVDPQWIRTTLARAGTDATRARFAGVLNESTASAVAGRASSWGGPTKSNFYDTATGEHYWISGPRKDGADRLYGERTGVAIDPDVRLEYWRDIPEHRSVAMNHTLEGATSHARWLTNAEAEVLA